MNLNVQMYGLILLEDNYSNQYMWSYGYEGKVFDYFLSFQSNIAQVAKAFRTAYLTPSSWFSSSRILKMEHIEHAVLEHQKRR